MAQRPNLIWIGSASVIFLIVGNVSVGDLCRIFIGHVVYRNINWTVRTQE